MAGTTGLEPAASAVTVSKIEVISTTWKSTDGTVSHWKYVIGNAIVYRHVYRAEALLSLTSAAWSPPWRNRRKIAAREYHIGWKLMSEREAERTRLMRAQTPTRPASAKK